MGGELFRNEVPGSREHWHKNSREQITLKQGTGNCGLKAARNVDHCLERFEGRVASIGGWVVCKRINYSFYKICPKGRIKIRNSHS